jgi:hypothetical protein
MLFKKGCSAETAKIKHCMSVQGMMVIAYLAPWIGISMQWH